MVTAEGEGYYKGQVGTGDFLFSALHFSAFQGLQVGSGRRRPRDSCSEMQMEGYALPGRWSSPCLCCRKAAPQTSPAHLGIKWSTPGVPCCPNSPISFHLPKKNNHPTKKKKTGLQKDIMHPGPISAQPLLGAADVTSHLCTLTEVSFPPPKFALIKTPHNTFLLRCCIGKVIVAYSFAFHAREAF